MSTKDIRGFRPTNKQTFIMDTNVLIRLLYPVMSERNNAPYEIFYQLILSAGSKLIISSVQVSEFVNRCIRFQFDLWKSEQGTRVDFKNDYRNSDDYRDHMNAILEIIKSDILPHSECINDRFHDTNSGKLYQYGFSYDFNDALVAEIARLNHAILITDDRDFGNYSSNIEIVTANKTLLMFR